MHQAYFNIIMDILTFRSQLVNIKYKFIDAFSEMQVQIIFNQTT